MKVRPSHLLLAALAAAAAAGEPAPPPWRPAVGPYVRYDAWRSATVCWQTDEPTASILSFGPKDGPERRITDAEPKKLHRLVLDGLDRNHQYGYEIIAVRGGRELKGEAHSFDTTFNYCPPPVGTEADAPVADARCAAAAERILRRTGVTKGYCLVYGFGRGHLAWELARRSELIVVGVDEDAARVAEARRRLLAARAYGPRITVRQVESMAKLPFPRCFANLVVSEDTIAREAQRGSAAEVLRVLRPGGRACLGRPAGAGGAGKDALEAWLRSGGVRYTIDDSDGELWAEVTRGPLPGAGRWTHQYGGPGNAAYGGESLGGAAATGDLEVQWLGRPGADFGLDRNPRMPAPLSAGGRLFHQGMNRIVALDAYNGAVLWLMEVPELRRVNIPRDASNWCADEGRLFVAVRDRCWVLGAATGRLEAALPLPGGRGAGHDWGYVARAGGGLFGSSVKRGSAYTSFWGHDAWYDKPTGPGTFKVCSDDLFRLAPEGGRPAWAWRGGAVLNTTIAIGGGRVHFVESRAAAATASTTGRIDTEKLWSDLHMVALDANTGGQLWRRPIAPADGTVVVYLVCAEGKLLLLSSGSGEYHLYTFDAADGRPGWQAAHKWPANNHGGHMQHPVVAGGEVYVEPRAYDLAGGAVKREQIGRREGCATYAATDGALIHRGQARRIALWDRRTGDASSWHNLRPSCWLSVIPAAGMVLAPEGGGGCSCGNWLEASVGFLPKAAPASAPAGDGE